MLRGLVPPYLASLIPRSANRDRYNLRRHNYLIPPRSRTTAYMKSFVPSSTRLWNGLDPPTQLLPTFSRFKSHIKRTRYERKIPFYWQGNDYGSANYSRLRMGLSGLNYHRFTYNFIDHSTCPNCQALREDICHLLFLCPRYTAHRQALFANLVTIPILPPVNRVERTSLSNILLFGDSTLNHD